MQIIKQKLITNPLDLLEEPIIDIYRADSMPFSNPAECLKTIFSWFNKTAILTVVSVFDFDDIPKKYDFPSWDHPGNHASVGRNFWNWFHYHYPNNELYFSDEPDFCGTIGDAVFWGDIGQVSGNTFARIQKNMRKHDLWISLLYDGAYQVLIEPLININDLHANRFHKVTNG